MKRALRVQGTRVILFIQRYAAVIGDLAGKTISPAQAQANRSVTTLACRTPLTPVTARFTRAACPVTSITTVCKHTWYLWVARTSRGHGDAGPLGLNWPGLSRTPCLLRPRNLDSR